MVDFPPLSPSLSWCRIYLHSLFNGMGEREAIKAANTAIRNTREFGRCLIDDHTYEGLTLSLAVEGGGRQLRNIENIAGLRLSDHGDWRRVHLRAFDACLGKLPYYRYIYPEMEKVYLDTTLDTLRSFNTAIFEVMISFLLGDLKKQELKYLRLNHSQKERAKELLEVTDLRFSLLQSLCAFGKETLLLAIN